MTEWKEDERCYLGGLPDSGQYVVLHVHCEQAWVMNLATGSTSIYDCDDLYQTAEEADRP